MAQLHTKPRDLNAHDPDFHERLLAWASQAQCEMRELILITKETIATTKAIIADVDRMLVQG